MQKKTSKVRIHETVYPVTMMANLLDISARIIPNYIDEKGAEITAPFDFLLLIGRLKPLLHPLENLHLN